MSTLAAIALGLVLVGVVWYAIQRPDKKGGGSGGKFPWQRDDHER